MSFFHKSSWETCENKLKTTCKHLISCFHKFSQPNSQNLFQSTILNKSINRRGWIEEFMKQGPKNV